MFTRRIIQLVKNWTFPSTTGRRAETTLAGTCSTWEERLIISTAKLFSDYPRRGTTPVMVQTQFQLITQRRKRMKGSSNKLIKLKLISSSLEALITWQRLKILSGLLLIKFTTLEKNLEIVRRAKAYPQGDTIRVVSWQAGKIDLCQTQRSLWTKREWRLLSKCSRMRKR